MPAPQRPRRETNPPEAGKLPPYARLFGRQMMEPEGPARAPAKVRPFFRVLLFLLLALATVRAAGWATFLLTGTLPEPVQELAYFGLATTGLLGTSCLLLRWVDRRDFRTVGLWFYPGWAGELVLGAGTGAGLLGAVVGVLLACGAIRYQGLAGATVAIVPAFLLTAVFLLLAAAFEEISFRGYGFQRLIDSAGRVGAVAVSAGLFGVLHLFNPSATVLSTTNTILIGVLLAVGYLKTRALWLPIGLHWSWNLCMGPILSLPVSGVQIQPMLLRAELIGPAWLGGGGYGPEGSLMLTAVTTAAIVWLTRTPRVATCPAMQAILKQEIPREVPGGLLPADLDRRPPPA